jgi:DNA gyrase subunit A
MVVKTSTHQTLYLVQGDGMAASVAVESIPEAESFGDGIPVEKVAPLPDPDSVVAMFTVPQTGKKNGDMFIVSATRKGMVKKSALSELPGPAAHAFTLMRVNTGDELGFMLFSEGNEEWVLFTAMGMAIRFKEDDVRPMGLVAGGVNAIKLNEKDLIIGMEEYNEKSEVLLIAEDGIAWRLSMNDFPLQGRYGQGVIACRLSKHNGLSVCFAGSGTSTGIIHFRSAAAKMVKISEIPLGKRPYSGKAVVEVKKDDEVIDQTRIRDCFQIFSSRTRSKKKME